MNDAHPPRVRLTAGLLVFAWTATLLGVAILLAGGLSIQAGGLAFRAHNPIVPFAIAAGCLAAAWRGRSRQLRETLGWFWFAIERRAAAIAGLAVALSVAIGLIWGTYAAGGSDSYCYLNQAEMFARGQLRQPQPIAADAPWPKARATFAPTGHLPATGEAAAIVPACPAGYPMLMAVAERIAGRAAMFWIVPIMGGLAVWFTFLLGRRAAGDLPGAGAAILLAASPAFLYQITQPMTDVPAVACWSGALLAALAARGSRGGAALAGLATGAALLVRPNLLPLAGVIAAQNDLRGRFTNFVKRPRRSFLLFWFSAPVLLFIGVILALNHSMHGSALDSGYGRFRDLFTLGHAAGNLQRYPRWLIETQTPFVLLACAAPSVLRSRERAGLAWWLLAFAITTFACYIPYTVWDAWWFLRFVLPAYPPLLVLSSAVAMAALLRLSPAWRTGVLVAVWSALVVFQLNTAGKRAVFELRDLEARFRTAGQYVARRLPENAIVFAVTESGSVRFYSNRQTLVWEALDPAWLDRSLEFLRAKGYRPYFLFELEEEPLFRERFGAASSLGQLDWPPMAEVDRKVRIYDPDDRRRYRGGEQILTDYFWTRR